MYWINRFDIHDLSSLVLQMVTLSAHTCSLARLFQLFITLCEKDLRRTVLFARCFTLVYGFPLFSWISSRFMGDIGYIKHLLFSILYNIIMSKRCRRYSNVGRLSSSSRLLYGKFLNFNQDITNTNIKQN